MTTDDAVKILEAVGDSWPAAVTAVVIVLGIIAWRALPHLKGISEGMKQVRHEFTNNSGTTLKDAIDRIEKKVNDQGDALDAHIVEAKGRDEEDRVWRSQVEDLLTSTDDE